MNYFRIQNFLNPRQNQFLFDWCLANFQTFVPSTVTTGDEDYRKSLVTYSCPIHDLVNEKVQTLLPIVSSALEVAVNSECWFESQVTSHGNKDYFKIHTDNNDPRCSRRILSYVYYLHSLPKGFEDGELALYSDLEKRDRTLITPDNNSLVCFASTTWHEVLPVVGSSAFNHGRFTVNGWINQ